jgi:L-aspartate oxidase
VITTRFPNLFRFCLDHGLDITKGLIPVAPAAHYTMGGVRTNIWGETNIAGLFAAGETACTGVHGANRLASNSLLEAVVFSQRIIERTREGGETPQPGREKTARYALNKRAALPTASPPSQANLQQLHWDKVSIIRNQKDLSEAAELLATWQQQLLQPTDRPSHELHNLVLTGRLLTEAACIREESRGAHFRADFPQSSTGWRHHIILTKD